MVPSVKMPNSKGKQGDSAFFEDNEVTKLVPSTVAMHSGTLVGLGEPSLLDCNASLSGVPISNPLVAFPSQGRVKGCQF